MRAARLGSEKLPKYALCGALLSKFCEAIWVERGFSTKFNSNRRNESALSSELNINIGALCSCLSQRRFARVLGLNADQNVCESAPKEHLNEILGQEKWNRMLTQSTATVTLRRCQQINKLQTQNAQNCKLATRFCFVFVCPFCSLECVTVIQFVGICLANVRASKRSNRNRWIINFLPMCRACGSLRSTSNRWKCEEIELRKANVGKYFAEFGGNGERKRIAGLRQSKCACHHRASDDEISFLRSPNGVHLLFNFGFA